MTADWYEFSGAFLKRVSNRIVNEVNGVCRVLYDGEYILLLKIYRDNSILLICLN